MERRDYRTGWDPLRGRPSERCDRVPQQLPLRAAQDEIHPKNVPSEHLRRWYSLHIHPARPWSGPDQRAGKTGREVEASFGGEGDRSISDLRPLRAQPRQPCKRRGCEINARKPARVQKSSQKAV